MGVPIGAQVFPLSTVWKTCEYVLSKAESVRRYVPVTATALLGVSGRTATSTTLWCMRPPPMQFQLHPRSGETLRPSPPPTYPGTPASRELSAITPIEGSSPWSLGKPRTPSQRYRQLAPLSLDGRMAYVARSTMRFGLSGAKTSWLAAGKRPLARDETGKARTKDAAAAARKDLRTAASVARARVRATRRPRDARARCD